MQLIDERGVFADASGYWLCVEIDPEANTRGGLVSLLQGLRLRPGSSTNEELMIARHTVHLLGEEAAAA